jgi:hypothetical protein
MRSPCCLYVCVFVSACLWIPDSTFECLNQSLQNFVCISWHLSPSQWLHKSLPSVCVSVCVSLLSLLVKTLPQQEYTHNSRTVGHVFFAVHMVSKEGMWSVFVGTSCSFIWKLQFTVHMCFLFLWLIPHPTVILTKSGSMECKVCKYICDSIMKSVMEDTSLPNSVGQYDNSLLGLMPRSLVHRYQYLDKPIHQTRHHLMPEDHNLNINCCENFRLQVVKGKISLYLNI